MSRTRSGRLTSSVLRLLGSNVATRLLGIGALAFYARMLTPSELAAQPVFLLLTGFVNVPFHGGVFTSMLREVPPELEGDARRGVAVLRAAVLWAVCGTLVVSGCYLVGAGVIGRIFLHAASAATTIRWMILGCILKGIDETLTFALRSTHAFGALATKKLLSEIAQPVFAVALVPRFRVGGLIGGQTIGLGLAVVFECWTLRRYLFAAIQPEPIFALLRRSKAYYLEGGVFFVTQQGDQAIVGALMAPSALAAYYIARRLIDALSMMLYTFEEVMAPSLSYARTKPAELAQTRDLLVFGVMAFVLPAALIGAVLAPTYAALMGGGKYAGIAAPVAILCLSLIPAGLMTIMWQLTLALGRPTDRLRITSVFAVLLLLATTLSAHEGLIAVAAARLMAATIAAGLAARLTRHLPFHFGFRDFAAILAASLVMIVAPLLVQTSGGSVLHVMIAGVPGAALGLFGLLQFYRRRMPGFAAANTQGDVPLER